jgi:adenylate kinase
VFFLDISYEAVLERLTLRATDPTTGLHYHLLNNPPRTQEVKERLETNPNDREEAVVESLTQYQMYREELAECYAELGAQRVNADQDKHTVFETIESMIVNPLPKRSSGTEHAY